MSLPAQYIPEIKKILESISANLPGYKPRQAQKRMISAVAEVLSRAEKIDDDEENPPVNTGKTILCVEGPTGVGKSLGYLIGATVAARHKECKLVISSATVALQEQLINKDLPFFANNSGLKLNYTIAKGRGRYVCHAKLRVIAGLGAQVDLFNDETVDIASDSDTSFAATLLSDYEAGKWSGDRDDLGTQLNSVFWEKITTDRHGCLNKKCPQFSSCAQMAARERIRDADIVVANHDLLLADMALGGGVILPSPKNTFYVLDEGHHVAQKGVDAFSSNHHIDAGRLMMEKLSILSNRLGQTYPKISPVAAKIGTGAEYLAEALEEVYIMFDSMEKGQFSSMAWRFPENRLPDAAATLAGNILKSSQALLEELTRTKKLLDELNEESSSVVVQKFLGDVGFFTGKVESIFRTWEMLSLPPEETTIPVAKWVMIDIKENGRVDYIVHACPVIASEMLVKTFFSKAAGVIITSATLMSMGNFDQLLRETGLAQLPDVSLLALASPFNHAEQGTLSIPDIKANAKDQVTHTAAIIATLPRLLQQSGNQGTLVLFASRRQMNEVTEGLAPDIRSIVLVQGTISKNALLATHAERIRSGRASVIFGLQSFSEGLDLPGALCVHVVVAKLPFAVPSDPVQITLSEWLSTQNKSYFNEIAVPQACLRMIQSAGRLIRTEEDTGTLTVLDDRLRKTKYGRLIMNSLPPFKQLSEIQRFH